MSSKYPGIFISFEGIDGAGKSTHLEAFTELLRTRFPNKQVVLTREPGGTSLGEKLRDLLLHESMHLDTEALLMFAARREHLAQIIEPHLTVGDIVISDRFTDASFAYQGGGRGMDLARLYELEVWVQMRMFDGQRQLIQPNLTLLFDLPGEVAESRRQSVRVADKFEKLNLGFFEKVRAEYLRRAKDAPDRFRIINANQDKILVWKELEKIAISI
jgi:dTMP kinase